jgi:hypothetical protein
MQFWGQAMPNRHPTGWMSETERGLTPQSFRFPQETVDVLDAVAAATGLPKREVVKEAIAEFAARRGIAPRTRSPRRHRSPSQG